MLADSQAPHAGRGSDRSDATTWTRRHRVVIAVGIGLILLGTTLGVAYYVAKRSDQGSAFVEVFLTDLPADLAGLDVTLAGVTVGRDHKPLELQTRSFDLLAHRGPEEALLVARGLVAAEGDPEIRLSFASAVARIGTQAVHLELPNTVLTLRHDFGLDDREARSVLFDINVDRSLRIDGPRASFEPYVESVFVASHPPASIADGKPAPSPRPNGQVDFTATQPSPPREQRLEPAENERQYPDNYWRPSPTPKPTQKPQGEGSNESGGGNGSNGWDWLTPEMGEGNSVPVDYAGTILGWFVQFAPEADSPEDIQRSVEEAGAELVYRFGSVPAAYILGTPVDASNLTDDPYVTYVEPLLPAGLHMSSSRHAIGIPQLMDPLNGIQDADGHPIDGRGIGVAVVDSGIDGLHPDLTHRLITGAAAPVRANYKVESVALVDMPYTDTTSGHGTHVAGIVAGRGTKDPNLRGVAPGATIYGFGIGELANTFWPNQAFDWIAQHGAKQDPPIRIVTNSCGSVGPYDPNSLTTRLVNEMVSQGMVVVFSAANEGGDGSDARTSRECRIPTPGVICVAWYDDLDIGSQSGSLHAKSSRGSKADESTWPDISAPGSSIKSARTPFGWVTGVGLLDYYVTMDGTSMAAPHVAGAAALMLQANPDLTAAQIDQIMKETAIKYGRDPYNANGTDHGRGHGLLDAYTAVKEAKSR